MSLIIHCCLSVRGAILWPKRELKGMFVRDGRKTTAEESREILMDHLAQGHEVLPFCACPDFDYSGKGCPGVETP